MDKLDTLTKFLEIMKDDTVKPSDIEKFLKVVLEVVNNTKFNLEQLSSEHKQTLAESIVYIEQNYQEWSNTQDDKLDLIAGQIEAKLALLKESLDSIEIPEQLRVEDVLSQIEFPKHEEFTLEEKGELIVNEINALPLEDEYKIDASHIKNLPRSSGRTYGGMHYLAGDNITIEGNVISATGGLSETFETVSKNLKSYPYEVTYNAGDVDYITYDLGGGMSIIKTFNYTSGDITSIVLSSDTPVGIDLTKTFSYVGGNVDSVVYS